MSKRKAGPIKESSAKKSRTTPRTLAKVGLFDENPHWDGEISQIVLPYQKESIKFAIENDGKILIADDMGLGKTIQAISIMLHYRSEWPLLVIAPSTLCGQWKREIERWVPDLAPPTLPEPVGKRKPKKDKGYTHPVRWIKDGKVPLGGIVDVISYSLLESKREELESVNYNCIIADECHYLKNAKAIRTKLAISIGKNAQRKVALSGTPILNCPAELFAQLKFLDVGERLYQAVINSKPQDQRGLNEGYKLFTNWTQFTTRYCNGHINHFKQWDVRGVSNAKELHSILTQVCMIRRKKEQVLTQLPPKFRNSHYIEIKASDANEIQKILKEIKARTQHLSQLPPAQIRRALFEMMKQGQMTMEIFRKNAEVKIDGVREYVKEILNNSDLKFLIFGHHACMLDGIEQELESYAQKMDIPDFHIRIDGNTKSDIRHKLVEYFQTKPQCRVALLSITAAGVGLTLTAASTVIFAEEFWNPGAMLQAEDRVHRIGQLNNCNIYYLVAKGSFDEQMWKTLNRKFKTFGSIIDGASNSDMLTLTDDIEPQLGGAAGFMAECLFDID